MTKYVSETKGGRSVSAWVVMKGARHVATVSAHYADSGGVLVNIRQSGEAAARCAAKNPGAKDDFYFQSAKAGGYGYDKTVAALSGLWIDGHELTNHCERNRRAKAGTLYPRDAKAPKGWSFANYTGPKTASYRNGAPMGAEGYVDCYRAPGLHYLESLGYQVIPAV